MIKAKDEEATALRKTTALLYESSDSSSEADEDNDEQDSMFDHTCCYALCYFNVAPFALLPYKLSCCHL